MTEKVAYYFRYDYRAKAVIYVRGNNKEFQEMMCRLYAIEKRYEVAYVTRHLEDVNLCDVLLVANFSRISRKQMEFVNIYKLFKERGIRIESAAGTNDISEAFSAKDIYNV